MASELANLDNIRVSALPHIFRRSVLLGITVVVTVALGFTIVAVLRSAYSNVDAQAREQLALSTRVFRQLMVDRNEQLSGHATLLAQDPRFKQAIAKHAITRSDRDIIELLLAHQGSIGADLSLLVDGRGGIISNAPPGVFAPGLLHRLHSNEVDQMNALVVIDEVPYQLVFAPLKAANWVAWVGMGYKVDLELVQSLKSVTGMRASLLYQRGDGPIGLLSTLPDSLSRLLNSNGNNLPASSAAFIRSLEENNWVSSSYPLLQSPDARLLLVLSTSVGDELRAFKSLRAQLLSLAGLVLILAGALAWWFSGKARQAVQLMSLTAQRLAHGDQHRSPTLADKRELISLEAAFKQMQRAIEEREIRYNFQAQHDQLTGVLNRSHFETWVRSRLLNAEHPANGALVLAQICGLSQLSDIYGMETASHLVKAVADRSREVLGPRDKIARFESDQFAFFFDDFPRDRIEPLKDRMTSLYGKNFHAGRKEIHAEIRMGMALCPEHGNDYPDLLRRCNIALSQTFINRSSFELYQRGQDALHLRKAQIVHALRNAAARDEFELFLQPQLQLADGKVARVEALLRWEKSSMGPISPGEFIPLAERAGQISGITAWLVDRVGELLRRWQTEGLDLGISINVSAQDLLKDSLARQLSALLLESNLDPKKILVEVTESAMVERPRQVVRNLRRLHRLGVQIAMDDFGTGFSSLSQLKSLPLDELKIDQAFILNLDKDEDDQNIVIAAIEMAHSLHLEVVAEGVENATSLHMLQAMGCDLAQGNYIGEAMDVKTFEAWIGERDLAEVMAPQHAHYRSE